MTKSALKFTKGNHGFEMAVEEDALHIRIPLTAAARKAAPMSASGKNKVIASTHGNIQAGGVTLGLNCYTSPNG